jgi:hypothetical protein
MTAATAFQTVFLIQMLFCEPVNMIMLNPLHWLCGAGQDGRCKQSYQQASTTPIQLVGH